MSAASTLAVRRLALSSAFAALFLGTIGLQGMGIEVASPATLVTLGHLGEPKTALACLGFLVMAGLAARRVPGADRSRAFANRR